MSTKKKPATPQTPAPRNAGAGDSPKLEEGSFTTPIRKGPSKKALRRRRKAGLPLDQPMPNPGRFTKGDPRINKDGATTRAFHQLRAETQELLNEVVEDRLHPERGFLTRRQHILLNLIESNDEKAQVKALEIGDGKVPDEIHQYNFDVSKVMEKVDLSKLTNEQIAELSAGKNIIEVLLGNYLK
jgi:hypothetical protein